MNGRISHNQMGKIYKCNIFAAEIQTSFFSAINLPRNENRP